MTSFICQHCKSKILLDSELLKLDTSTYSEVLDAISNDNESITPFNSEVGRVFKQTRPLSGNTQVSRKVVHSQRKPTEGSYFLVDQNAGDIGRKDGSDEVNKSLSDAERISKLFDTLAEKSDIDFPLCEDCTEIMLKSMDEQLSTLSEEKRLYEEALNSSRASQAPQNKIDLEMEVKSLLEKEKHLSEELNRLIESEVSLEQENNALSAESIELDKAEKDYWRSYNEFDRRLKETRMENDGLERQLKHVNAQLEKLKKTNVLNDVFNIWHDGPFGTINGFRLGRLPDQDVSWDEINSAWGQAALLLYLLIEQLGIEIKNYRIVPLGSYSKIEKIGDDKVSYELYGSGDLQLNLIFWNRRFDQGMTAFLNCLQQVGEYAEMKDPNFKLPYKINKDKIGGEVSIKSQFNQYENWTKALKYMLTDLKWILAFKQ